MTAHTYLTFNGNCRQAMSFYQKCLGGVLRYQTVGDAPFSKKMTAKMKRSILQGTLRKGKVMLMGTDMVGEMGLIKGNAVSVLLYCKSEEEAEKVYGRLSRGGRKLQALKKNYFGIIMGGVTDKFGYSWIVTA